MKNKNRTREKEHGKRARTTIAISQILILVIATIAFSWMIGSEVKEVSASDDCVGRCVGQNLCKAEDGISGSCTNIGDVCCKNSNVADTCDTRGGACVGPNLCSTGTVVYPSTPCAAPLIYCCVPKEETDGGGGGGFVKEALIDIVKIGLAEGVKEIASDLYKKGISDKIVKGVLDPKTGLAPGPTKPKTISKFIKGPWGQLLKNAAWAAATYLVINYFAKKYASVRNAGDISVVTGFGAIIGVLTAELIGGPVGWVAAAITALFAGVYMLTGYQLYSREIFTFRVGLWQPPVGGADCNKCNLFTIAGETGCSEYICHSYGLACDWVNDETQYETCIEVNKGDVTPPRITPLKEVYGENVFLNNKYDYRTTAAGTTIIYTGEGAGVGQCVPVFTPILLAFKTDENAHCKISIEPATGTTDEKFSKMQDMVEGTSSTINHTLQLHSIVTASQSALENAGYKLTNGGKFKFYIRCKDVRGNINQVDYQMSFCVQQGPDSDAPEITGTNPPQNSFISYGTDKIVDFQVYTSEPAYCKWDIQRKSYTQMSNNFYKCSESINDPLVGFDFGCQTNLTGFKNAQDNKYYISCRDQPELNGTVNENKRNTGSTYELVLKGTERLLIRSVRINERPNGTTIRDSTANIHVKIEVTTSGGAEEGDARCLYSQDATPPRTYSLFNNENSRNYVNPNTQDFYMPDGIYKYFLECYDIANNQATTMINFSVELDNFAPIVVRAYKDIETNSLKLITDEVAECVYSNHERCTYSFEEGEEMDSSDGKEHSVEWNSELDFYVICKDEYGNLPKAGCSIEARPFEIFQVQ